MAPESTKVNSRTMSATVREHTLGSLAISRIEASGEMVSKTALAMSETNLTTSRERVFGSAASWLSGCQRMKRMRVKMVRVLSVKTLWTGKATRVTFCSKVLKELHHQQERRGSPPKDQVSNNSTSRSSYKMIE